ncbi:hypothetical protein ACH5RR_003567 [Cinchona calisaya]|uniref:Uncharacterized protein n=1 Tax=Cinchona calisaya TaxID=153742 RepID=A0ABD3AV78_9GENT
MEMHIAERERLSYIRSKMKQLAESEDGYEKWEVPKGIQTLDYDIVTYDYDQSDAKINTEQGDVNATVIVTDIVPSTKTIAKFSNIDYNANKGPVKGATLLVVVSIQFPTPTTSFSASKTYFNGNGLAPSSVVDRPVNNIPSSANYLPKMPGKRTVSSHGKYNSSCKGRRRSNKLASVGMSCTWRDEAILVVSRIYTSKKWIRSQRRRIQ